MNLNLIKALLKQLRNKVLQRWGSLEDSKRINLQESFISVINYLLNSFLLAVPLHIFSFFFFQPSFKTYLLTVLCLWISLPFIESYYVWFREDWKKDAKDVND